MARFKLSEISLMLKCRRPLGWTRRVLIKTRQVQPSPLVALAPVSMTDAEAATPWLAKNPADPRDADPTSPWSL